MRAALREARKAVGRTCPNPPVGAVVVRRGRIVGAGHTAPAGGPHAEPRALREAGARAHGATVYVTLEPCAHFGRTPPCVAALLEAGVGRVVVGVRDPNPHVAGGGVEALRAAGVAVDVGIAADECAEILRPFRKHVTTGRPLVTLKLAASLDGRIATARGDSRWITGEPARRLVHRWRDAADAVMVGAGTVIADDPRLTCRRRGGRDPLRVVIDGRLRVPPAAAVFNPPLSSRTVLVTGEHGVRRLAPWRERGVEVIRLPARAGRLDLGVVFDVLGRRGLLWVMIEGGGGLAAEALRQGVADEMKLFLAPRIVGGDGVPVIGALGFERMTEVLQPDLKKVSRVGEDLLVEIDLGGIHAVQPR